MDLSKKTVVGVLLGALLLGGSLGSIDTSPSAVTSDKDTSPIIKRAEPTGVKKSDTKPTTKPSSDLSNDNYYTNTYGNKVHSPAYSTTGTIPSGATAKCKDGTYSFSQSRRGTCSHHGGVAKWL